MIGKTNQVLDDLKFPEQGDCVTGSHRGSTPIPHTHTLHLNTTIPLQHSQSNRPVVHYASCKQCNAGIDLPQQHEKYHY
jgi:hypothetical protein